MGARLACLQGRAWCGLHSSVIAPATQGGRPGLRRAGAAPRARRPRWGDAVRRGCAPPGGASPADRSRAARHAVTDAHLAQFATLLGKNWLKALQVIDQNMIQCFTAAHSGRQIYQVAPLACHASPRSPRRLLRTAVPCRCGRGCHAVARPPPLHAAPSGAWQVWTVHHAAAALLLLPSTLLRSGRQSRRTLRA